MLGFRSLVAGFGHLYPVFENRDVKTIGDEPAKLDSFLQFQRVTGEEIVYCLV